MNSWNQNQMGQTQQFNSYWNTLQQPYGRAPVYKAEPINGKEAAWNFPIGGGEIWLPDANQDIVWWIRIDQTGNKSVMPFDIKPHQDPAPVDMNNLLERISVLEEKVNAKQSKSNAKRTVAAVADAASTATVSD